MPVFRILVVTNIKQVLNYVGMFKRLFILWNKNFLFVFNILFQCLHSPFFTFLKTFQRHLALMYAVFEVSCPANSSKSAFSQIKLFLINKNNLVLNLCVTGASSFYKCYYRRFFVFFGLFLLHPTLLLLNKL